MKKKLLSMTMTSLFKEKATISITRLSSFRDRSGTYFLIVCHLKFWPSLTYDMLKDNNSCVFPITSTHIRCPGFPSWKSGRKIIDKRCLKVNEEAVWAIFGSGWSRKSI